MAWYEFCCPECDYVWGSQQPTPDRNWCSCGTVTEPELIGVFEDDE